MWLSENMKRRAPETRAELGVTSIAGEEAAVLSRGEVRALPVYGPGGYCWIPEAGESVLVIQGGPGGGGQWVGGAGQGEAPEGLGPGGLCLRSGTAAVILRKDGSILLRGTVQVEGELRLNGAALTAEGG